MEPKKVTDSMTEQVHVVIYPDINGFGRLFGGQLLKWIDEVAGGAGRPPLGGQPPPPPPHRRRLSQYQSSITPVAVRLPVRV